jgi:cytochrome c biogenesis protein CcdA/thiol-disulfide isomerase/thioredoxin
MFLLILFSFIAGVATILSPCILPVLPIVLSGTVGNGKKKPLGIILGFVLSFTFFTLITSSIVKATGVSADLLRNISIVVIFIFGASLLIPNLQVKLETFFSGITSKLKINNQNETGFVGGVIIGLSLGLLWTPCVGPIIASVIVLAATSKITGEVILITFSYSLGTGLMMFLVMQFGRKLFQKIPWLLRSTEKIQKIFGVLMILTALSLFLNFDRKFQIILQKVLPDASFNQIENNSIVKNELNKLSTSNSGVNLAPEIIAGGSWFNSKPLTLKSLRGKVVLIDFWTYTCINCIRTLPYVESWYEKYKDQGLVVIGVHTPEFEFEKNADNVARAIKDFGITYPIIQDNNYGTWNAFGNQYWPAKYFIDKNGSIRDTHFGEGNYDESESLIQDLLKETGAKVSAKIDNPASNIMASSPETYLNSSRMQYYYPDTNLSTGSYNLKITKSIPLNTFSLGGKWEIGNESATVDAGSVLLYHFSADKVFLVMKPSKEGQEYFVKVFLDDKLVDDSNSGADIKNGEFTVNSDRLYNLIDLKNHPGDHLLRLEFQTPGLELFAFTFG